MDDDEYDEVCEAEIETGGCLVSIHAETKAGWMKGYETSLCWCSLIRLIIYSRVLMEFDFRTPH